MEFFQKIIRFGSVILPLYGRAHFISINIMVVIRGAIKWRRWILLAESKNYDPPCLASGSFAETKVSFNPRLVHNERTKQLLELASSAERKVRSNPSLVHHESAEHDNQGASTIALPEFKIRGQRILLRGFKEKRPGNTS